MAKRSRPLPRTLRVLRAERDLTQKEIGDRAGLTQTRYWQIEHGQGTPTRTTEREGIARALMVRSEDIAWPTITPTRIQEERARRRLLRAAAVAGVPV